MAYFEVTVEAVLRVSALNFNEAAETATEIVKGTRGRPDSARDVSYTPKNVTAVP